MANNPQRPRNQAPASPEGSAQTSETPQDTGEQNADTSGKDSVVVETPTPEPVAAPEQAVAPAPEPVSDAADADILAKLETQLRALLEAGKQPGRSPEDFTQSAEIVKQLTRFVVRTPRVSVLDRLLQFFEENAEGAAVDRNYLKGTAILPNNDQRQITYLHTLFTDLAAKRLTRINNGQVLQILKKPEILDYYNRKIAVLRQNAG